MSYGLTPREIEVASLVLAGQTDHQVANTLVISAMTVAAHLARIMAKVGVETREELISRLSNEGLN